MGMGLCRVQVPGTRESESRLRISGVFSTSPGGEVMSVKSDSKVIRLRRIPDRSEMFDLFRQAAEKIRREKSALSKSL